jgi:hypothetical protein
LLSVNASVQHLQFASEPSARWKYVLVLHAAAQSDTLVPAPSHPPFAWHSIPVITIALVSASQVAAPSVVVLPLKPELQAHVYPVPGADTSLQVASLPQLTPEQPSISAHASSVVTLPLYPVPHTQL